MGKYLEAKKLKKKQVFSRERYEMVVPAVEIDRMEPELVAPVEASKWLRPRPSTPPKGYKYICAACGEVNYFIHGHIGTFCSFCGRGMKEVVE